VEPWLSPSSGKVILVPAPKSNEVALVFRKCGESCFRASTRGFQALINFMPAIVPILVLLVWYEYTRTTSEPRSLSVALGLIVLTASAFMAIRLATFDVIKVDPQLGSVEWTRRRAGFRRTVRHSINELALRRCVVSVSQNEDRSRVGLVLSAPSRAVLCCIARRQADVDEYVGTLPTEIRQILRDDVPEVAVTGTGWDDADPRKPVAAGGRQAPGALATSSRLWPKPPAPALHAALRPELS